MVSAEGWGPGFSGANCTFRITSLTEFLGRGCRAGSVPNTQSPAPTSHRGLGLQKASRGLPPSPFVAFLF